MVDSVDSILATLEEFKEVFAIDHSFEDAEVRKKVCSKLHECERALLERGVSDPLSSKPNVTSDINVLIVDDDNVSAMLLSNQLTKLDIRNEYVLSGQEALGKLYLNPDEFQLVLLDVNMPGLNGGQVLSRILQDNRFNLSVVMVSSDTDVSKAKALVDAGAKDYIVKPVKQISLVGLSFKVNAWNSSGRDKSGNMSKLYDLSSSLLLNLKLVMTEPKKLEGAGPKPEVVGGGAGGPTCKMVQRAIVMAASPPMRQLLGITEAEVKNGTVDMLHFVLGEDREILKREMQRAVSASESVALEQASKKKLVWRWVDVNGNNVPVVGNWYRIGDPRNHEIHLESSSLLPSLLLKREKERREFAEKKGEQAMKKISELKQTLVSTKKSDLSMRNELNSMLCEMSEFSKMVTENPQVLTWRFAVDDGKIQFVSQIAAEKLLGYNEQELLGKYNRDFLHPEDVERAHKALQDVNQLVRLRRIHKNGDIVWVESRSYAWWAQDEKVIIVTEYGISDFM